MKFYSEMTKELYDTETALINAEREFAAQKILEEEEARKAKEAEEAKKNERKARIDEIETARKEMLESQKKYERLVSAFVRDYKAYNYSFLMDGLPTILNSWIPCSRIG